MPKKIMAIFAHPDDEGAIGGTLAHYAQAGAELMLLCATRGEVGEISDPALATPATLGAVRERELQNACEILGIQHLAFLDYRDSGMAGTAPNDDPRALIQADPDTVTDQIAQQIRHFEPDVVITFEPYGWYGHPDHIAVSRWATAAYSIVADQETERPMRLLHAVLPASKFRRMIDEAVAAGLIEPRRMGDDLPQEALLQMEAAVTHVLDVQGYFDLAQRAMRAHQTQFGPESIFRKIPRELWLRQMGSDHFIQVCPAPAPERRSDPAADLFVD